MHKIKVVGQSTKAIELYSTLKNEKSFDILNNVAIQTSVAAAYCDLCEYSNAITCAKRAYALCNGNAPDELKLVFKRIGRYIDIN